MGRVAVADRTAGQRWDTIIVGAGPAGCAAAAGCLRQDPGARVLLLDRDDFPRDKPCGDGIAAEALGLLAGLDFDLDAVTAGYQPIRRLRLTSPGGYVADRNLPADVRVIPREVFDHRLLLDVVGRGAVLHRHAVRTIDVRADEVVVDGHYRATTLIGADGAESTVRRGLGLTLNGPGRVALAIRGYAPELPGQDGAQHIIMTGRSWPAYAWSFPTGGGRANVGYGELLAGATVTRAGLLDRMHRLLPGLTEGPTRLRAHRLPLSTYRPRVTHGRVLLVGDADSLINPMTGEGIFYAITSGAVAGRVAAHASRPRGGETDDAAARYRRLMTQELGGHLRHTSLLARAGRWPRLIDAGVRAAAADQRVFDDLARLGLADGRISARMLAGLRP